MGELERLHPLSNYGHVFCALRHHYFGFEKEAVTLAFVVSPRGLGTEQIRPSRNSALLHFATETGHSQLDAIIGIRTDDLTYVLQAL